MKRSPLETYMIAVVLFLTVLAAIWTLWTAFILAGWLVSTLNGGDALPWWHFALGLLFLGFGAGVFWLLTRLFKIVRRRGFIHPPQP